LTGACASPEESDEEPPESFFERRLIDKHRVNMLLFNQFAKPRSFFPHRMQPGDTVRVFYMESQPDEDVEKPWEYKRKMENMKQTYFDGTILAIEGKYQARMMKLRTMLGKPGEQIGTELQFPIMSPLVTKIEMLRRGYIGRNKNAYFLRGLFGKRQTIPLDKERTAMDQLYEELREDGREDEIPESDYPMAADERYPLPQYVQDQPDWDEDEYDPDLVDLRSEYEKYIIDGWKHRRKPPIMKTDVTSKKKGK